jgi:hypothetical protein
MTTKKTDAQDLWDHTKTALVATGKAIVATIKWCARMTLKLCGEKHA